MDTSLDKRELSTGHVGFFDVRREFKSKMRYFFLSFFFLWFLYFEEIIMSCFYRISNDCYWDWSKYRFRIFGN